MAKASDPFPGLRPLNWSRSVLSGMHVRGPRSVTASTARPAKPERTPPSFCCRGTKRAVLVDHERALTTFRGSPAPPSAPRLRCRSALAECPPAWARSAAPRPPAAEREPQKADHLRQELISIAMLHRRARTRRSFGPSTSSWPGADSRPRQRRSSSSRLKAIWGWGNSRLPSRCMRPASRRSVPSTMSTSASSPGRFSGSRPPCDERAVPRRHSRGWKTVCDSSRRTFISDPARRNARRAGTRDRALGLLQSLVGSATSEERAVLGIKIGRLLGAPSAAAGAADVSAASLHSGLSIGLVLVNQSSTGIALSDLCLVLESKWLIRCEVMAPVSIPEELILVAERGQYAADKVLDELWRRLPPPSGRPRYIVGLTGRDISALGRISYSPGRPDTRRRAIGVISAHRFLAGVPDFYEPAVVAGRRLVIQALSTTGFLLGFTRSTHPECPMAYPNDFREFQQKRSPPLRIRHRAAGRPPAAARRGAHAVRRRARRRGRADLSRLRPGVETLTPPGSTSSPARSPAAPAVLRPSNSILPWTMM